MSRRSKQLQQRRPALVAAYHHEGPLPPPEQLAKYDEAVPGLAERIVTMAEDEGRHRRDLEQRDVRIRARGESLGLIAAVLICLAVNGLAAYALTLGASAEAVAMIVAEIAGLAGVFVLGRKQAERKG